jgi:hypothetical protein
VSVCVSLSSCQGAAVAAAEAEQKLQWKNAAMYNRKPPKKKRKKTGADER